MVPNTFTFIYLRKSLTREYSLLMWILPLLQISAPGSVWCVHPTRSNNNKKKYYSKSLTRQNRTEQNNKNYEFLSSEIWKIVTLHFSPHFIDKESLKKQPQIFLNVLRQPTNGPNLQNYWTASKHFWFLIFWDLNHWNQKTFKFGL